MNSVLTTTERHVLISDGQVNKRCLWKTQGRREQHKSAERVKTLWITTRPSILLFRTALYTWLEKTRVFSFARSLSSLCNCTVYSLHHKKEPSSVDFLGMFAIMSFQRVRRLRGLKVHVHSCHSSWTVSISKLWTGAFHK